MQMVDIIVVQNQNIYVVSGRLDWEVVGLTREYLTSSNCIWGMDLYSDVKRVSEWL